MRNIITEVKNILQGINSRVVETEDQISDLEGKEIENTQTEQQKETVVRNNEDSLRSLCKNFKHANICKMGVPAKEKREERN